MFKVRYPSVATVVGGNSKTKFELPDPELVYGGDD